MAPLALHDEARGPYGVNIMEVVARRPRQHRAGARRDAVLRACASAPTSRARRSAAAPDAAAEEAARRAFVAGLQRALRLETPDPVLDHTFAMAKLRVAEAINATRGGLMLAPGGLAFYAATWCNDNVEYAGPFFPFLGDDGGDQASLDSYRGYGAYMKPDYQRHPLVDRRRRHRHLARRRRPRRRGDVRLWLRAILPGARRPRHRRGAVAGGRLVPGVLPAPDHAGWRDRAPTATSSRGASPPARPTSRTISLYYGGLRSAADLARALGRPAEAAVYDQRAATVAAAIERCFGATVEGFATYRYFDGCDVLRSWICLPLCMGLMERRDATIAALFSPRLWTADGLATQAGNRTFWDRSTLYGLRGVFQAGETAKGLRYLTAFSQRRLLGDHVPYAVETGAQGNQLSSESALYCRIFSEGLFGILPTGLDRFRCTPRLPDGWPRMALRSVRAFGREWDLVVERQGAQLAITVAVVGHPAQTSTIAAGGSIDVVLP